MSNSLRLGESLPRRAVIFRALQLGDLLCAAPALRSLRAALPQAEITLVGLPWARSFAERFSRYIDRFLAFPGYPGLPEQTPRPEQFPAFFSAARHARFDLALQMHGSGVVTNPLTLLLGARLNAGFFRPGTDCPDERYFLAYPTDEPEVRRLLRLVEFLGVPSQGEALEFPLTPEDYRAFAAIEEIAALQPATYVCVHPGARASSRRWWPERFAAVADALAARGFRIVLTGSAEERRLAHQVAQCMHAPTLNLAGRTNLGALAVLLSQARLLVCNDTGISHLAAALQVPSVVIFSASDPDRWAPLDGERHRAISRPIDCRPCPYPSCPIGHPCAARVTPETVLAQVDALLGAQHGLPPHQPNAADGPLTAQPSRPERIFP